MSLGIVLVVHTESSSDTDKHCAKDFDFIVENDSGTLDRSLDYSEPLFYSHVKGR